MNSLILFFFSITAVTARAATTTNALTQFVKLCHGSQPAMGMTRYTVQPRQNPCEEKQTALVYSLQNEALFVCENSENVGAYYVSIGSRGTGKTREGDRKTPVGKYSLGKPRASAEFGIFIPVGYPNASDQKKGYSGGDVGIHGPKRFAACMGALNVAINWTAGCVAMASDQQILEMAEWVQKNPSAKIYIE